MNASELAACAAQVLRAVGVEPGAVAAPESAHAAATLRARVARLLDGVRPDAAGASLGELVSALTVEAERGWPDRARARQALAELRALFDQAAFRRTKRAERGRIFAQLIVVLELEPAAGVPRDARSGLEEQLRRVRSALRER
jgi:hypothetical protein